MFDNLITDKGVIYIAENLLNNNTIKIIGMGNKMVVMEIKYHLIL